MSALPLLQSYLLSLLRFCNHCLNTLQCLFEFCSSWLNDLAKQVSRIVSELFSSLGSLLRRYMFRILSMGPIPNHVAFIMDGNRRYAKHKGLEEVAGYRLGFSSLMYILEHCYVLGVKYVSAYAFSIDNFRRSPDEVQGLMDLLLEKIEEMLEEESIVNQYGIRVFFIGNLTLLSEPVRLAAEKIMGFTACNSKFVLLICIAYTSCDEIVHAVQESCKEKLEKIQALNSNNVCTDEIEEELQVNGSTKVSAHSAKESCKDDPDESLLMKPCGINNINKKVSEAVQKSCEVRCNEAFFVGSESSGVIPLENNERAGAEHCRIQLQDIENHMYMGVAPDPDILIRSSGETRLSNFLLWQTSCCPLYSPKALWPDIGLRHLVWAVLKYQHNHPYLEKKKKQL